LTERDAVDFDARSKLRLTAFDDYPECQEQTMSNGSPMSLSELEQRIADVRENIRQLIEQAAAFSGAEDEDRNADRIEKQNAELDRLTKQRDALLKK
jgi:septal ring factor EnvC (AmiA/AmiB activator)